VGQKLLLSIQKWPIRKSESFVLSIRLAEHFDALSVCTEGSVAEISLQPFVCGGIAAKMASACVSPMDVTKVGSIALRIACDGKGRASSCSRRLACRFSRSPANQHLSLL